MGTVQALDRKPYRREESRIVFSTSAPGLVGSANSAVSGTQTPAEARAQAEIMSVALSQPHRRGSTDKRAGEPLYDFFIAQRLRDELYTAGVEYETVVHQHRVLMGLGMGNSSSPEGRGEPLSDAQLRANCEAARMKRDEADYALVRVAPNAKSAMIRLCVDKVTPSPYDESVLRRGLWALAVHFGIINRGINEGKRT